MASWPRTSTTSKYRCLSVVHVRKGPASADTALLWMISPGDIHPEGAWCADAAAQAWLPLMLVEGHEGAGPVPGNTFRQAFGNVWRRHGASGSTRCFSRPGGRMSAHEPRACFPWPGRYTGDATVDAEGPSSAVTTTGTKWRRAPRGNTPTQAAIRRFLPMRLVAQ